MISRELQIFVTDLDASSVAPTTMSGYRALRLHLLLSRHQVLVFDYYSVSSLTKGGSNEFYGVFDVDAGSECRYGCR